MKRMHAMPFGAALAEGSGASFRFWAPAREQVRLELLRPGGAGSASSELLDSLVMTRARDGWHRARVADAHAGLLYRYRLDDSLAVPDPASRFNPLDVHGPSELVDPLAHDWSDEAWRGRPWHEAVVYELHVGTFTPAGTFAAARERLPELAALGVTAIELMPVAEFAGGRSWGYDGVLPYAPDAAYGRPEELKRFVQAAHALGLMVLLDVVYNHFGPEGNYLGAYAPQFFDASRHTPWGAAIAFDGPGGAVVRDYFVQNALFWVVEYGFDGLRLDAVHAIEDRSSPTIVEAIARALHEGPGRERCVHLVLENDRNEARLLEREVDGDGQDRPRWASAQWNDDLHHALHVLLSGESDGYYADYADAPVERLGRALAEGFVYQGEASPFRGGERRGEPSGGLPPQAFVAYLQTHDQVGNRAFGERLDALADPTLVPAGLACLLLAPQVPMLFMGEEYAASTPFQYFCDFCPELAEAVRKGRREEFGRFEAFRDPAAREAIPDPNALATFEASKLRWDERAASPHRERLALVQALLRVRGALAPRLGRIRRGGRWRADGGLLELHWQIEAGTADLAGSAGPAQADEDALPGAGDASDPFASPADREAAVLALRLNFGEAPVQVHAGPAAEVLHAHEAQGDAAPGAWTLARGGVLFCLEPAHG